MLDPVNRTPPLIAVVDDDESVREALPDLLWVMGYESVTFASAEDFLAANGVDRARCLILDVGLPGMSGPQLQQELVLRGHSLPTVFITGRPDLSPSRRCLLKPFSEQDLRAALEAALA